MTKINLTHAWREDWKSFLSADQKKQHWIAQRLLEDERDLQESEQPPIPKYVPEKKETVNPLKVIYMFLP